MRRSQRNTWVAASAPLATARRLLSGKHLNIATRWRKRAKRACSVILTIRSSTTPDSLPRSLSATENFSSTPMVATASSMITRSNTPLGSHPLQQYLDRVSRRPAAGAVDCVGRASQEGRRPALVPSLPQRADHPRRRAALDASSTKLELHVRGLPLDRCAEKLRSRRRPIPDPLGGDQRGLRSVPRPGLESCGMGQRESPFAKGARGD